MSTVIATSVLPDSTANDTLTIGATGDSVVIGGNLLQMNTLQDTGGNTIFVSDGAGTITSAPNLPGAMKSISTQTASGATNVEFKTGIDSTYDVYIFKWYDIDTSVDGAMFQFNGSTVGGASYAVVKTTTWWYAYNTQGGSNNLTYGTAVDLAQSTAYQTICYNVGNGATQSGSGELNLYAPSSTTYVKKFNARSMVYAENEAANDQYPAGYFITTSAINAIDFKTNSGTFSGTIALFGISKT